jgi:hypothetical protein
MKQVRKIGIPFLLGIYVYMMGISLMPHHHCHAQSICFDSINSALPESHGSCCSTRDAGDCTQRIPAKCNDIHCVSNVVYHVTAVTQENINRCKPAVVESLYLLSFLPFDELIKMGGWNASKFQGPDHPPLLYRDFYQFPGTGFRAPPVA